jgi:hypothetical protein
MDMFLTDLLNHWGFDEPERYLKKEEPQQQQVTPTPTSGNPLVDAVNSGELPSVGMANALQQQISADGGMNMMNQLMSGTELSPNTTTQGQQEMMTDAAATAPTSPAGDPTAALEPGSGAILPPGNRSGLQGI